MIVGAFVLPPGMVGMMDASTTRSPATAAHAQLGIDDRERVRAHLARADRVKDRVRVAADGGADIGVASGTGRR